MIKFFGAVIILCACSGAGFYFAKQYSNRPRQIRQLRSSLQALEAEVMFGLTPVGEAAEKIASQLPLPVNQLFHRFSIILSKEYTPVEEAWERAIQEIWSSTSLKESEKEVLRQFGSTLGKHDADHQRKTIHLALSHLEREEHEARVEQNKYEKMYKSLGFLSGLLIALVLY